MAGRLLKCSVADSQTGKALARQARPRNAAQPAIRTLSRYALTVAGDAADSTSP